MRSMPTILPLSLIILLFMLTWMISVWIYRRRRYDNFEANAVS
jgi:hypothetical protein